MTAWESCPTKCLSCGSVVKGEVPPYHLRQTRELTVPLANHSTQEDETYSLSRQHSRAGLESLGVRVIQPWCCEQGRAVPITHLPCGGMAGGEMPTSTFPPLHASTPETGGGAGPGS